ncbi:MAG: hypothetical protein NC182_02370 [Prevotella sp.]|nr:hypothetical protein [Staphylococcus sp.]MCM1350029.1 hypothetical protein [Prevotella sp.]
MKKIIMGAICVTILLLSCISCKKKTECEKHGHQYEQTTPTTSICTRCGYINFASKSEIQKHFSSFDISININGITYRLIRCQDGYYYANGNENVYGYYDAIKNESYCVDPIKQQKIKVIGNYDFSSQIEDIFYVLLYHLSSETIQELSRRETTYLNRDVIEYYRDSAEYEEVYRIDNATGACLYFCLGNSFKKVICKVENISTEHIDLEPYQSYESLQYVDLSTFIPENKVIENFSNYHIQLTIQDKVFQFISAANGYYYESNQQGYLYDKTDMKWYKVDHNEKIKMLTDDTLELEQIESELFKILTSHLTDIQLNFYTKEDTEYIGRKVHAYERVIVTNQVSLKEYYYVDVETGACLKKEVNSSKAIVTKLELVGNIDEFLNYQIVENNQYKSWPKDHPYLEGIEPIEYGTFYFGNYTEDGLRIGYKDIQSNHYLLIKERLIDAGFIENKEDTTLPDYSYYTAKNSKQIQVTIEYTPSTGILLLLFAEVVS